LEANAAHARDDCSIAESDLPRHFIATDLSSIVKHWLPIFKSFQVYSISLYRQPSSIALTRIITQLD
jgi:hypothetical protein